MVKSMDASRLSFHFSPRRSPSLYVAISPFFGAATLNVAGIFRLSIQTVPQLPKPKVSRLVEGRAGIKLLCVYIRALSIITP